MRVVHQFRYSGGKIFEAGDLTVGDYMIYLADPVYAVHNILSEFNNKPPKLTSSEITRFMRILLDVGQQKKPSKKSDKPSTLMTTDFHIVYAVVCSKVGCDVSSWTMSMLLKVFSDLHIVVDITKYDEHRNSERIDSEGLMQATGGRMVV